MKKIFPILLAVLIFSGCKKEEADTQKPVITISGPETNEVLYVGTPIHFEVDFSDDTELKSYKVDIHSNFDGHNHKSTMHDSISWSYQKSWNFDSGLKNSHVHHHEIVIPSLIGDEHISTGDYHFMIYYTDAAGNESWLAVPVKIFRSPDTLAPVITIQSAPTASQVFASNDTVKISGTISDDKGLEGLFIAIMPQGSTNTQVNPTECLAVMLHQHDGIEGETTYSFTASIKVGQANDNNNPSKPVTWTPGNYFVIVKAPDEGGNESFSAQYPIVIQ